MVEQVDGVPGPIFSTIDLKPRNTNVTNIAIMMYYTASLVSPNHTVANIQALALPDPWLAYQQQ